MKRILTFLAFLLMSAGAYSQTNWQAFPTCPGSTTGATCSNLVINFVPTSAYTTYKILVSDSLINNFSTGYSWTNTTAIQVKDSNGNNVCSTPGDSSVTIGGITFYHWEQDCNSGTLTNGNTYTVNISATAYYAGTLVAKPPQVMVFLNAQ